jgi:uridine kinase
MIEAIDTQSAQSLTCRLRSDMPNTDQQASKNHLPAPKHPLVIGVAGGSGSGKTTVTQAILERVGRERITMLPHDSYYHDLAHLPLEQRARVNFDHPDAFDNGLYLAHLEALIQGQQVAMPTYDFTSYVRLPEVLIVPPQPVVLLEGILIFADAALRAHMSIKLFVDAESDLRIIRRIQRDTHSRGRTVESVIEQYLKTVRPMHLEFVEPSKRYADIIIPNGGLNAIAIDMVVARIERMLDERAESRQ